MIFISYSTLEHETASDVVRRLEHIGKGYFWAGKTNAIPAGTPDYWKFIEARIAESECMFLMASELSLASKSVLYEISLAKKHAIKILPFYKGISPERLLPLLGRIQAVDANNEDAVGAAIGQIARDSTNQAFWAGAAAVGFVGFIVWLAKSEGK